MCGRFDITIPPMELKKLYRADISKVEDFTPRHNVAPTQNVPVLFGDAGRNFDFARFGMHPKWFKFKSRDLINLRKETLEEKPFFRRQLERSRCILPATGFFEWKREGKIKTPYRFIPKDDETFSLACVWEMDSIQGRDTTTFAIITGPPNDLMAPIHDRMPVIIPEGALDTWLDAETDTPALMSLLKPYSGGKMKTYRVSRDVNNPANDDPSVLLPVSIT